MSFKTTHAALALSAVAAVALPAAALAGANPVATPSAAVARVAQNHTVVLKNTRFHPAALSIHRGDSVTWLWRDGGLRHNVTGSGFRSRTQSTGSFTARFGHRGTFNYVCTIHAALGMKGKIVVH